MEKETRIAAETVGNLKNELDEIQRLVYMENAVGEFLTTTRSCQAFLTIYCC